MGAASRRDFQASIGAFRGETPLPPDNEGCIIEMDLWQFILFNIYFPNSQMSDERYQYKLDFAICFHLRWN